MSELTPEEKEGNLVDRVDFRIIDAANNEEKLQALLKTYLCPLILKVASEHVSVRNKVLAATQRLRTFIKPPGIVLPVAALLAQFKSTDHAVIQHLDVVFMQHSIGRLEPFERRDLLPVALKGIGGPLTPRTRHLFNLVLQMLPALRIPSRGSKEDESLREDLGLSAPKDAEFVAHWLGRLILLKLTPGGSPGLSQEEISFLTLDRPETWDPSSAAGGLRLPESRIRAVNLLASGAFTDQERFIPAICAAASNDGRVSSVGDDLLKRSAVSLEEPSVVTSLFQAHRQLPPAHRARVLGLLSKSSEATKHSDEIKAVVERDMEGLYSNTATDSEDTMMTGASTHPQSSQAPSGLEWTKLLKALFEFINWVARVGPSKSDFVVGETLIDHLLKFVRMQGWPRPTTPSPDQIVLRTRAYETVGELARTAKLSAQGRASLFGFLFRSLSEDPTDVPSALESALTGMAHHFRHSTAPETGLFVRTMLLTYTTSPPDETTVVRSTRAAAVKCANRFLPFSDATARWIDILAVAGSADERHDVVEEGQRGLDPWTHYANDDNDNGKSRQLPDWAEMARLFFTDKIPHSDSMRGQPVPKSAAQYFANFDGDRLRAFPLAIRYCTRLLFLAALKDDFKIDPGWERQLETKVRSDLKSRDIIRRFLARPGPTAASLATLLMACIEGVVLHQTLDKTPGVEECLQCLVDVASLAPKEILRRPSEQVDRLLPTLTANNAELRLLGARAYGILAAHPAHSETAISSATAHLTKLASTWKTSVGSPLLAAQGAFLGTAHLYSRAVYYGSAIPTEYGGFPSLLKILPTPAEVSAAPASFQNTLFDVMTQLWTAGILGLPEGDDRVATASAWVDVLLVPAKKGNERAIAALGRLGMALNEVEDGLTQVISNILDKLYELYELKQAEVHFAVGDAITAIVARWESEVVQLVLDVEPKESNAPFRLPSRLVRLNAVLGKLLQDCKTTKPALLKAAGIWLFCVIQHCSHLPEIQSWLRESQAAFMRLLSARDELVQETASRGLALAYEKGDPVLREALVRDLVAAFTGSGPKLEVDADTELFDAGALPTGEGKSVTSYKDIVSLANEVGDQTLIYKFMSLATNAATWSTRSAFGRFGLSSILSDSEVDPRLYPKLYRYRFDPNPNVQRSMNDIWKALVPDSSAVIGKHFDAILLDLLKSVLGKEWRVREASCAAISDLLGGQRFDRYEKQYRDVWAAALRVLDDVKATVREAALRLCMNLSNTLVRQLEESGGSGASTTASAMMAEALPFLLSDKGIESGVEEVKVIATITVLQIAKHGGKALRPFIAEMVPLLLGLLSTIEPDAINYHYQRSGEAGREKIDRMRSAAVSQSPISQAIEDALRCVDAETMPGLVASIETTVKGALGMPTKIGCGRLLSTLAIRHGQDFAPHTPRLLQLMEKHALDRNDEVSQSYAKAAAYMLRVAPVEAKDRFAAHFTDLYYSAEDEHRRQKVSDAVLSLSKISPDHFSALESSLLPLAYIGSHDTDPYVQKAFGEVWAKHAGSDYSVSRYGTEIIALASRALDAPQWALKHAGALASGAMVKALASGAASRGGAGGQIEARILRAVWPLFDRALALKTFEGKEKVLASLPALVERGHALWKAQGNGDVAAAAAIAAQLKKIAIREAKRNNDAYRVHALDALWRVARVLDDQDMGEDITTIAKPYVDMLLDGDRMELDAGGDKASREKEDLETMTAARAFEAIALGYSRPAIKADPASVLHKIRSQVTPSISTVAGNGRAALVFRPVWYRILGDVLADSGEAAGADDGLASWYFGSLEIERHDIGTEEQRTARAKAAMSVLAAVKKGVFGPSEALGGTKAIVRDAIHVSLSGERSEDVRKLLSEAYAYAVLL